MKRRTKLDRSATFRLFAMLLALWLISATLFTFALAGDIRAQGVAHLKPALEIAAGTTTASGDSTPLLRLTEQSFPVTSGLPLVAARNARAYRLSVTLNSDGLIVASEGLETVNLAESGLGITILGGKLAFSPLIDVTSNFDGSSGKRVFNLTFAEDPARNGSFPSAEYDNDYPEDTGRHDASTPITPGNRSSLSLLDGIEAGTLHFDSHSLSQSSCLTGKWLRDADGNPQYFTLAAYGWSPLFTAMGMLPTLYLVSLLVFLVVGLLFRAAFLRLLIRPLKALSEALDGNPLSLSSKEFDFTYRFSDIQDVIAPYLLRDRLTAVGHATVSGNAVSLPEVFRRVEGRLQPILLDRGLRFRVGRTASGKVAASEAQAEDVLLSLIRETTAYAELDQELLLNTDTVGAGQMVTVEMRAKNRTEADYAALYEGIFLSPRDDAAPGALLRKSASAIPGSVCYVRRTELGLALSVIFPSAFVFVRKAGLNVETLPDGKTLVYDGAQDKTFLLNESAAFVLEKCDGITADALIQAYLDEYGKKSNDWFLLENDARAALSYLLRLSLLEKRNDE